MKTKLDSLEIRTFNVPIVFVLMVLVMIFIDARLIEGHPSPTQASYKKVTRRSCQSNHCKWPREEQGKFSKVCKKIGHHCKQLGEFCLRCLTCRKCTDESMEKPNHAGPTANYNPNGATSLKRTDRNDAPVAETLFQRTRITCSSRRRL